LHSFPTRRSSDLKLILIGDTAQLPPVNLDMSPALEEDNTSFFGLDIGHIELDEVMRQEEGSGILHNATQIRELLKDDYLVDFHFDLNGFKDIVRLTDGYDIQDAIFDAYERNGVEETSFIVRSN